MPPQRRNPSAQPSRPLSPQPVPPRPPNRLIYKSAALTATAPNLAFRQRASSRIAAASAAADAVREKFKDDHSSTEDCSTGGGDAKKYRRRLLMNRKSAGASRVRREAYVAALEKELAELEAVHDEVLGSRAAGCGGRCQLPCKIMLPEDVRSVVEREEDFGAEGSVGFGLEDFGRAKLGHVDVPLTQAFNEDQTTFWSPGSLLLDDANCF